jgi:hypothetical protein
MMANEMVVHSSDLTELPGGMSLTERMSLQVTASLRLGDKGGGVPPPCRVYDSAQVRVSGNFNIWVGDIAVRSTAPFFISGNFENWSLDPEFFDWLKGAMTLDGDGLQEFEVSGINLGATLQGFSVGTESGCGGVNSNFAIGRLELAGSGVVHFSNAFDNSMNPERPDDQTEALYVRNLILRPGSRFTCGNQTYVYYVGLEGSIAEACLGGCERIQAIPCAGGPDVCLPPVKDCPLSECVLGPGIPVEPACRVYDRDADTDVDLFDFAIAGPNIHW